MLAAALRADPGGESRGGRAYRGSPRPMLVAALRADPEGPLRGTASVGHRVRVSFEAEPAPD